MTVLEDSAGASTGVGQWAERSGKSADMPLRHKGAGYGHAQLSC